MTSAARARGLLDDTNMARKRKSEDNETDDHISPKKPKSMDAALNIGQEPNFEAKTTNPVLDAATNAEQEPDSKAEATKPYIDMPLTRGVANSLKLPEQTEAYTDVRSASESRKSFESPMGFESQIKLTGTYYVSWDELPAGTNSDASISVEQEWESNNSHSESNSSQSESNKSQSWSNKILPEDCQPLSVCRAEEMETRRQKGIGPSRTLRNSTYRLLDITLQNF
jgi:hypothetical protein